MAVNTHQRKDLFHKCEKNRTRSRLQARPALLCFTLLCFTLLCFARLHFTLPDKGLQADGWRFTLASQLLMIYFALLCFTCFTLLYCALLCFTSTKASKPMAGTLRSVDSFSSSFQSCPSASPCTYPHTFSIRQHTSAYVSMNQALFRRY